MLIRPLLRAVNNLRTRSLSYVMILFAAMCTAAYGGGGPRNVMVVRNLDSTVSKQIANYYIAARQIPPENVCDIHASTSEIVSQTQCINEIVTPVRNFLANPAISDHIDYIVLTKGIALGANYSFASGSGPISVTSLLTCVSEPTITTATRNMYGPNAPIPVETAFSHSLTLWGKHYYLVTRLDGYTVSDVLWMIDRSIGATNAGSILLDAAGPGTFSGSYNTMNNRIINANTVLAAKGIPTIFDATSAFLGGRNGLMGYFSWGSNDPSFSLAAYESNSFLPGSIADTFVSTSARTFNPTTGGQSLIADLIVSGACGVAGYVSEPSNAYTHYADVLFKEYTAGYNMAESFYMADPYLFWKTTVVGDPLMAAYANPPAANVITPHEALTGTSATIVATAYHPNGISKVDFFLDKSYIGRSTTAPYAVHVDTTQCAVGNHSINVIAYENSPVASQGFAAATVQVSNPLSILRRIADSFVCEDGQEVKSTGAVVIAGTADMGGSEFYISDTNRAAGIRVKSTFTVAEGDIVTIQGSMVTDYGERVISADDVIKTGSLTKPLAPLYMSIYSVGGSAFCDQTPGVSGGVGLRNMGLLVKLTGKVGYVGNNSEQFFYINDGRAKTDSSGHPGLRIVCQNQTKPLAGSVVSVVGIVSCQLSNGSIIPIVKIRRSQDLVIVTQGP